MERSTFKLVLIDSKQKVKTFSNSCVTSHPNTHYKFYQEFSNGDIVFFIFHDKMMCGVSSLVRLKIKGWLSDECISMYIINTIPHGK